MARPIKPDAQGKNPDAYDELKVRVSRDMGEELRAACRSLPRSIVPSMTAAYTEALADYLTKLRKRHNGGKRFA